MPDNVYQATHKIRSYEVDFRGLTRASTLLNFLQDLASEHAEKLGFSLQDLFRQNKTWVLSRNHIKILKFPRWNENIIGETWPSGRNGLFALRDFRISDDQENDMAVATSSWMLLDLERKRPVKLDDLKSVPLMEERALYDEFQPLQKLEQAENETRFRVRLADLDVNKHVNNVIFVEWALETAPNDILWHYAPVEIEIGYRSEVFYGDVIISRSQILEEGKSPKLVHQLVREKDGKEIAVLHTKWVLF